MLITTGGGTRSWHIDTIGLEMGMPPYDYFASKPPKGRIPIHRTDV